MLGMKARPKSAVGHGGRGRPGPGPEVPAAGIGIDWRANASCDAPATSKRVARRASGKANTSKGAKLKKTAVRERDEVLQSNSSDVTVADAVLIGSVMASGESLS
jgi:hypothetical protein